MKKISLFLMVLMLLVLSACGDSEVEVEEDEAAKEDAEIKINLDKKLGINIDDVLALSYFKNKGTNNINIKSYEMEAGTKIDEITVRDVDLNIFAYYYDGNKNASEIALRIKTGNAELTEIGIEIIKELRESLDDDVYAHSNVDTLDLKEGDEYDVGAIIFNNEHELSSLVVLPSQLNKNDFFSNDSNVTMYEKAWEKSDYKKIYEEAVKHTEDNEVSVADSAYEIIEIVEPLQDILGDLDVQHDEFDNKSTIYYKGLTDIGKSNYIVPFIETNDKELNLLVGFEKEGWLFTKKLTFNIDGEKQPYISIDPETDTLGGSTIREEYVRTTYDSELIENIIDGDEIKMRFEGKDGNLDYTLSEEDKDAIKTINKLNEVNHDLSNLLFHFDQ